MSEDDIHCANPAWKRTIEESERIHIDNCDIDGKVYFADIYDQQVKDRLHLKLKRESEKMRQINLVPTFSFQ